MKNLILVLSMLLTTACAPAGLYDYDSEFPCPSPYRDPSEYGKLKEQMVTIEDTDIHPEDSLELQALKIAAAKSYGNAKKYYMYQEKWAPGSMARDIEYLRYLDTNPAEAAKFQSGIWRLAIDELRTRRANQSTQSQVAAGFFPGIKIVHATGTHSCWSSQAIGYTCMVEIRMYTDCDEAVRKLQQTNCCKQKYPDGVSNFYMVGSCF